MATKAQIFNQLESQDWILTEVQKPKFRSFLSDYTVEVTDLPLLRKIVIANGIGIDKFKDSALFEKIKNDVTARVEDATAVLDHEDLQSLKGERFANLKSELPIVVTRGEYRLQFVDIEKTPRGYSVFVRAEKNGEQIGFGKDGTVDIERFRFNNPPVLVEDPSGDIERKHVENDGQDNLTEHTLKFKEDYKEAVIQCVLETIRVKKQVFDSSNIVPGKVGNTTTTEYPASGNGGTTSDGYQTGHYATGTGTSWANETGLVTGFGGIADSVTASEMIRVAPDTGTNNWRQLTRAFFSFDTSAIGTDTIDSATFSVYLTSKNQGSANNNPDLGLYEFTPSDPGTVTTADYDQYQTTLFATVIGYSSITASAYNDFALNATGLADINKTGVTALGITNDNYDAEERRVGSAAPTWSNGWWIVNCRWADYTGDTYSPKIVIEHSAGVGATFTPRVMFF